MTEKIFDVGRVCTKIAGRDAGQKCVVVNVIDETMVVIDGVTRRRKCNTKHLEPSKTVVKVEKDIATDALVKVMLDEKIISEIDIPKKGTKDRKKAETRPKKAKVVKKQGSKKPAKK